ncbi:MAG: radical SAM protein [Aquificaceae bacterium]
MQKLYPSYLNLEDKDWKERTEKALSMLEECRVCPHTCGVNRLKDELGICKTGRYAIVDSFFPHRGEEKVIRGIRGSGTVFFSHCNLKCVYCQNYRISQLGEGKEVSQEELSNIFITLQRLGCHNINLVTPSHIVPQTIQSIYFSVKKGLRIPIVYNTSSYDSIESLRLLDGIVDIYLADIKYGDDHVGRKYSKVKDYFSVTKRAIEEMYRQVGDMELDSSGMAKKGLIIRHLILPNEVSGTKEVTKFLRGLSPTMAVNIMDQYYPYFKAFDYPELSRRIRKDEYLKALNLVGGLTLVE